MSRVAVPTVACAALRDLKALLQSGILGHRDVVLQAQHQSLLALGGADAKEPTESHPIHIVSSTPPESIRRGFLKKPDRRH